MSLVLNFQNDDWFSTVSNSLSSSLSSALCDHHISTGYECEAYDISDAKDTWHDSETSDLREVSRIGRNMNVSIN